MRQIHAFHDEALWFAENTPHPFRCSFHPQNAHFASVAARYICELARRGNEDSMSEVAHIAIMVCECLDELLTGDGEESKRAVEMIGYQARELSYWPMLHLLHTAGNNHFPRLAERLKLGSESWANISERACYSLQTPKNRYAWRVLRLFQEGHEIIRRTNEAKAEGKQNHWPQLEHYSLFDEAERQIVRDSFDLGKPTKATAKAWVDRAIMPFICAREKDFAQVPEFADAIRRAEYREKRYSQRKEIRRGMIEAVKSIAPEN